MTQKGDILGNADAATRWYLPGWPARLKLMGWRLVYFLPLGLLLPLILLFPFLILMWWKLIVLAVALPLGTAINAAKHAIRQRTEPFCIHCGYNLTGLADGGRCPECGAQFWHMQIDDYRLDPHWYIKRQKMNGELPPSGAAIDAGPVRSPKRRDGT